MKNLSKFPFEEVGALATKLIAEAYQVTQLVPMSEPPIAPIPERGEGLDGLTDALRCIVDGSAGLAAPAMMGHMDTAPHPAAVFADAVVAALNNNLLFREISPFASRVEEAVVAQIGHRLGLSDDWGGTFVSGGSLANLTGLFAAVGGFADVEGRADCTLFVPQCAHLSIQKAAAILGITPTRVHTIAGDNQGRADLDKLAVALRQSTARRKIVVGVLGSTVHGAVEDIQALTMIAQQHDAWLHVDAVYGGALAFSHLHKERLAGLDQADSVVVAPQKWLYVPRVSAIAWIKGQDRFDDLLGMGMPYSATGDVNRSNWGLQGSRRADVLTLWAVLRYIGADALGREIDRSIHLTKQFHDRLEETNMLQPTHLPDLNLQCFGYNREQTSCMGDDELRKIHHKLGRGDLPWVSLSQWQGEKVLRAVLMSPSTEEAQLTQLIDFLVANANNRVQQDYVESSQPRKGS